MNFINNHQNKKLFFINLAIIFIPILEFLLKNSNELDFYIIKNLLKIQIIIILIFIICNFIFVRSINKNFKLFYFSICFYFSFKYYFIENLFHPFFQYRGEISFFILLIIFLFLYIILKRSIIVFSSLKIFFAIYFIIILSQNLLSFKDYKNFQTNSDLEVMNFDKTSNLKSNIYFVIIENMTDINLAKEDFQLKIDNFIKSFDNLNGKYINNVYANYNKSHLSIATLMNLNLVMNENSEAYKNKSNFFPHFLDKSKISKNFEPNLFKILKEFNYNIFWIGNTWVECDYFDVKSCINKNNKKNSVFFLKYLKVEENILKTFFSYAPYVKIYNKLRSTSDTFEKYKKDDAIKKFLDFSKSKKFNKGNFFFIHQHVNKYPYIRNENCEMKTKNYEFSYDNYIKEYNCSLLRIIELLKFINLNDPNAKLLVLSDQGLSKLNGIKKSKIFALEKTNNCIKSQDYFDSLSLFKTFLNCALNINLRIEPNKVFVMTNDRKVRLLDILN